jgi:hypothetical protein
LFYILQEALSFSLFSEKSTIFSADLELLIKETFTVYKKTIIEKFIEKTEKRTYFFLSHVENVLDASSDDPEIHQPVQFYNRRSLGPEEEINFDYGGGFFFIGDFLQGKVQGYQPDNMGESFKGIYVSIYRSSKYPSAFYSKKVAQRANYMDFPAIFSGTIKAKYLEEVPGQMSVWNEGFLRWEFIRHVKNRKIIMFPYISGLASDASLQKHGCSPEESERVHRIFKTLKKMA